MNLKIDFSTCIFFNSDISVDNHFPSMTFHIPIENIRLEGTVSQIFHFMKSRKIIMKK